MSSKLIKALASAHEETRDEAIQSVDQYVQANGQKLNKLDLEKLWKGLYYAVWFSDGAENQQNLCEDLSRIFNGTNTNVKVWSQYQEAFWKILIKEWASIDQWRMDKYYLLIRRILRGNFKYSQSKNWNAKVVDLFNDMIKEPLGLNKNMAIPYHLCDIYVDELVRVDKGITGEQEQQDQQDQEQNDDDDDDHDTNIPEQILQPFKELMKTSKSKTLKKKITEEVLDNPVVKGWWGPEESEKEEGDDDDDEDDEWHGF